MRTVIAASLALALAGCDQSPQWKGWVYPRADNLSFGQISIGAFATLEECRRSAQTLIANFHLEEDGEPIPSDYECGYKCKIGKGIGDTNLCDKTER
jgi:hypothetical protein